MEEKYMVNDVLTQLKGSLATYAGVISESENPQLRQKIQDLRNSCETFQWDLFKVAEQKGYYKPASPANQTDINTVKTTFQG